MGEGEGLRCAVGRRRLTAACNVATVAEDKVCEDKLLQQVQECPQTLRQGCGDQGAPCLVDAEAQCVEGRRCQKCTPEGGRQSSAKVNEGEAKRPVEVAGRGAQVTGGGFEPRAVSCQAAPSQAAGGQRRALGGPDGSKGARPKSSPSSLRSCRGGSNVS